MKDYIDRGVWINYLNEFTGRNNGVGANRHLNS
jgi:hypothetical protein